jgi:hypothetical protein
MDPSASHRAVVSVPQPVPEPVSNRDLAIRVHHEPPLAEGSLVTSLSEEARQ